MNINKTVWSDVGDPRVVCSSCFYSMIKINYVERAVHQELAGGLREQRATVLQPQEWDSAMICKLENDPASEGKSISEEWSLVYQDSQQRTQISHTQTPDLKPWWLV